FDAEAVAIATRRALGRATSWEDLEFDVIGPQVMAPVMHVALDEVLPGEVMAGRRPPIFRIWDWDSSLVVIGSYQSLRNEVDPDGAAHHDIGVVRRITGGGAMFMEQGNCITYSLIVPTSLVEGLTFEQSYAYLDDWVMGALAEIGVKAHYVPLNDIASEQGKIGGAAQRRFAGGVLLHHVTWPTTSTRTRLARGSGAARRSSPTRAPAAPSSAWIRCDRRRDWPASSSSTGSWSSSAPATTPATPRTPTPSWTLPASWWRPSSARRSGPRGCREPDFLSLSAR